MRLPFIAVLLVATLAQHPQSDKLWKEKIKTKLDLIRPCKHTYDNRYGTDVTVYVLKDQYGKDMNKQLYHEGKNIALHGIWPKENCYDVNITSRKRTYTANEGRISMEPLTSKDKEEINKKIDIYKSGELYQKYGHDFSPKGEFVFNEYNKHWFKNGYTIESFLEANLKAFENLEKGINVLPHECRFNGSNYLSQVVEIPQGESVFHYNYKETCKKTSNGTYEIFRDPISKKTFQFEDLPLKIRKDHFDITYFSLNGTNLEGTFENIFNNIKGTVPISRTINELYHQTKNTYEETKKGNYAPLIGNGIILATTGASYFQNFEKTSFGNIKNKVTSKLFSLLFMVVLMIGSALVNWFYFNNEYFDFIETALITSSITYVLNIVFNIFSSALVKINFKKSVVSVLTLVGIFYIISQIRESYNIPSAWSESNLFNCTKQETINFLKGIGMEKTLKNFLDKINHNYLDIIKDLLHQVVFVALVYHSYLSRYISKQVTSNKSSLMKIANTCLHIFSVTVLAIIIKYMYNIYNIKDQSLFIEFSQIYNKTCNFEEFYNYYSLLPTGLFNFIHQIEDFVMIPYINLAQMFSIYVLYDTTVRICFDHSYRVRMTEVTFILMYVLNSYNPFTLVIASLLQKLVSIEVTSSLILFSLIAIVFTSTILHLWSNQLSFTLLSIEFLIFLPVVKYMFTIKFLGLGECLDWLLTSLGLESQRPYFIILFNCFSIGYIHYNLSGIDRIYRYVVQKKMVEKVMYGKSLLNVIKSVSKVFVSLLIFSALIHCSVLPLISKESQYFVYTMNIMKAFVIALIVFRFAHIVNFLNIVRGIKYERDLNILIVNLYVVAILQFCVVAFVIGSLYSYNDSLNNIGRIVTAFIPSVLGGLISRFFVSIFVPTLENLKFYSIKNNWFININGFIDYIKEQVVFFALYFKINLLVYASVVFYCTIRDDYLNSPKTMWAYTKMGTNALICVIMIVFIFSLTTEIITWLIQWGAGESTVTKCKVYKRVALNNNQNLEVVRNNVRNPNYFEERVTIDDVERTVFEHLTHSVNIQHVKNIKTHQHGEGRNITNGYALNQVFPENEDNEYLEDFVDPITGNRKRVVDQTYSRQRKLGVSTKENDVITEIENSVAQKGDLLTDLGLAVRTRWVEGGVRFVSREELTRSKSISLESFNQNYSLFNGYSIYIPSLAQLEEKLNLGNCSTVFQSYGCANVGISEKIKDGAKSVNLRSYFSEFVDTDEVHVILSEEPVHLGELYYPECFQWVTDLLSRIAIHTIGQIDTNTLPVGSHTGFQRLVKKEDDNDNIYTYEEYRNKTKHTFEQTWNAVKNEDIFIVVSERGKRFVTYNRNTALALKDCYNTENNMFSLLEAQITSTSLYVRPFIFDSISTVSTLTPQYTLKIKINKEQKILFSDDYQIYISRPINMDNYPGSNIRRILKQDPLKGSVMGLSTGMVYKDYQNETSVKSHIGSCSLVRVNDDLCVVTNRHVVQNGYSLLNQNFILKNYTKVTNRIPDITHYYEGGLLMKTSGFNYVFTIPMRKLLSMGDDFAVFLVDPKTKKDLLSIITKVTKRPKKEVFEEFAKLGTFTKETSLYLNTNRQNDFVVSAEKNKVFLRNILIKYNDKEQVYESFGYSTPGFSGSPIWSIDNNQIYQNGIVSAMENVGLAKVHMTRIIDCNNIRNSIESSVYTHNVKDPIEVESVEEIKAVLPCITERLRKLNENNRKLQWCSTIDQQEQWANENYEVEEDVLFCGIDQHNPKNKKYWDIYNQDFSLLEVDTTLNLDTLKELCKAGVKKTKSFDYHIKNFDTLSLVEILKSINERQTFTLRLNQHIIQFEPLETGFWEFSMQSLAKIYGDYSVKQQVKVNTLTVDDQYVVEIVRSCLGYVDIGEWINTISKLNSEDKFYSCFSINGELYFTQHILKDAQNNILEDKEVQIEDIEKDKNIIAATCYEDNVNVVFVNNNTETNEQLYEKIKSLIRAKQELKDSQKLQTQQIQKIRNLRADFQKSYEYLEMKKKWDDLMASYNVERKHYEDNKDELESKRKQLLAEQRDIEKLKLDAIKAKRNEVIAKRHELREFQSAGKKDIEGKRQIIQGKINKIRQDIKSLEEKKQKLHESMKGLKMDSIISKKIDNYIKMIEQMNKDVDILQKEKQQLVLDYTERRKALELDIPKRPDMELNPDNHPKMKELEKELQEHRRINNELNEKIKLIEKELSEQKLENSKANMLLMGQEAECNFLKGTIASLTTSIEELQRRNKEQDDNIRKCLVDLETRSRKKKKIIVDEEEIELEQEPLNQSGEHKEKQIVPKDFKKITVNQPTAGPSSETRGKKGKKVIKHLDDEEGDWALDEDEKQQSGEKRENKRQKIFLTRPEQPKGIIQTSIEEQIPIKEEQKKSKYEVKQGTKAELEALFDLKSNDGFWVNEKLTKSYQWIIKELHLTSEYKDKKLNFTYISRKNTPIKFIVDNDEEQKTYEIHIKDKDSFNLFINLAQRVFNNTAGENWSIKLNENYGKLIDMINTGNLTNYGNDFILSRHRFNYDIQDEKHKKLGHSVVYFTNEQHFAEQMLKKHPHLLKGFELQSVERRKWSKYYETLVDSYINCSENIPFLEGKNMESIQFNYGILAKSTAGFSRKVDYVVGSNGTISFLFNAQVKRKGKK